MKTLRALSTLFALTLLISSAKLCAATAKSYGSPNAIKGGTFTIGYPDYPKDLLFYLGFDEPSDGINGQIMESLLNQDPQTYEFVPGLASEWKISKDKMTFTFVLDKEAHFSDGKPVTAQDVKFTWDTILDKKNKTAPLQALYESFESCKVVDNRTVEFKAKTLHFKNFEKVASLMILPKHFYSQGDFNRAFHTKILGSGPYVLDSLVQGQKIVLKRDPNYWAINRPENRGMNNFERLVYRVVPDYNVQYELFKKGELDYFYFLSSKMWSTETSGPLYQKNYIKKLRVENDTQYGTQGIVWNLRKPLFQDKRVRIALTELMDRERWIKELFYGNYQRATGPVAFNSVYHSPKNNPLPFDPKKARELLKEAGWSKVGSDGILVKDGQRFEFDVLIDNPSLQNQLTLYQEELKKVGIKLNIRQLDWATAIKLTDDRQFDAVMQARSRDVDPADFAVVWGSTAADIKGSANTAGYKNPELDKLATEIDSTFDKKKRIPLVQRIDALLGADQPMSFSYEATFFRLGYWNRYSFPGKGYFNYSTWKNAFNSWWMIRKKTQSLNKLWQKEPHFPKTPHGSVLSQTDPVFRSYTDRH